MNRLYLLVPLTALVLFLGYYVLVVEKQYRAEQQRMAAEQARLEEQEAAEIEARRAAALAEERKRREEAERAEAERRARRREQQRRADEELRRAVEEARGEARTASDLRAEKESHLANLQRERKSLQDAVFQLERDVELMQIARRNADLEIQRLLSIVAVEMGESSLLSLPEFPRAQPDGK